MMNSAFRPAQQDIELSDPPADSVSKILFNPVLEILAVASWDNNVRLYDVNSQGHNKGRAIYPHGGPVLDLAWSKDGKFLFSAGCDKVVKMYDLEQARVVGDIVQHDAPVKCVRIVEIQGQSILISAGWDKKIKYTDSIKGNLLIEQPLKDRVYAMDATDQMVVVGTADRCITVYDLEGGAPKEMKSGESPLKWQTRVISCFPKTVNNDEKGYAVGSIEGRVGVQYTHSSPDKSFSFKCHRVDIPVGSMPGSPATTGSQNVFAVNDITFHKEQGTFVTGGGDGSFTSWDAMARTKLKTFSDKDLGNGDSSARPPQWGLPIVSMSFNRDQTVLAYAMSYDWSKGHNGVPPEGSKATRIMLHAVKVDEVNRKKR